MLKFTSRDYPSFSDDYVMTMNAPSFSARRDAAYDRAIEILSGDVMGAPREKRASVYDSSLRLLMVTLDYSSEIFTDLINSSNTPNPYEQFLILLVDTVRASSSLLNHEIILYSEEKEMKSFIGKEFVPQARIAEAVFSQSEADIYRCITDLIKVAAPAIRTYRRSVYEKFKKEERERYDKAFKEFSNIYAAETL